MALESYIMPVLPFFPLKTLLLNDIQLTLCEYNTLKRSRTIILIDTSNLILPPRDISPQSCNKSLAEFCCIAAFVTQPSPILIQSHRSFNQPHSIICRSKCVTFSTGEFRASLVLPVPPALSDMEDLMAFV